MRLPADIDAAPPIPGDLAGPIEGIRLLNGAWTAPSFFMASDPDAAPKIMRIAGEILADGPLFAEARVRYDFSNGGYYTATVRLIAGDPGVRVDERMDMTVTRWSRDWRVVFPLTDAEGTFRPDVALWVTPEGRLPGEAAEFESAAGRLGFPPPELDSIGSRRHLASKTFKAANNREVIYPVTIWYSWHPAAYLFGLAEIQTVRAAAAKATGNEEANASLRAGIPFVGVVPMHSGSWRGIPEATNGDLLGWADGRVAMSWPLTPEPRPGSLLHTGEYDPEEPDSVVRRLWAFMAGPMQYIDDLKAFRSYEGYITLDRYKDWILDWQQGDWITYPRLVTSLDHVNEVRGRLDSHPAAEELKKLLTFNDDPERARQVYNVLASDSMWSSPRGVAIHGLRGDAWVVSYRYSQMSAWVNRADEVLSSEHLTAEQRALLRTWIAAQCYVLAEPDFNPRGSMVHLGNPNMPMNRFFGLPMAATLIPDHPKAKRWMEVSREYVRFKAIQNIAPVGAWSELLTYYQAGASHVVQAAMALDKQGMLDDATASLLAQTALFPMTQVSPPDPRFDNTRTTPNWGHEGYAHIATAWLPAAAFMRDRDPKLAALLVRAWDQLGRPVDIHHDAQFTTTAIIHADLLDKPVDAEAYADQMAGQWIPGMGATLRAHAGDPDETWLAFRKGYMISHCDANQGEFVLYGKGGPLSTFSIYAYPIHQQHTAIDLYNTFGWHSLVRFGRQTNLGGNVISEVQRFSGSPSVDYLRGKGVYAPQDWHRQWLFLKGKTAKSPNYFILRDSFIGEANALQPKWWNIRSGGGTDNVTRRDDGMTIATDFGTSLDVKFLSPAAVTLESRDAPMTGPIYSQAAVLWKRAGGEIDGHNVKETLTVTAAGPVAAGEDILVVLYPRAEGEAAPKYEVLAPGVAKITTAESTDYVFLSVEPFAFANDLFSFEGRAGAVRVYKDEAHLVINEGPGKIEYYGKGFFGGRKTLAKLDADIGGKSLVLKGSRTTEREMDRGLSGYAQRVAASTEAAAPYRAEPLPDVVAIPGNPRELIANRSGATQAETENGVTYWTFDGGFGWTFDSAESLDFRDGGDVPPPVSDERGGRRRGRSSAATPEGNIVFQGKRGAIIVDEAKGETAFLLTEADYAAHGRLKVWGDAEAGPALLIYGNGKIVGRTKGIARLIHVTAPTGLDRLAMYIVDGQTYAPGTMGERFLLPVLPGEHVFTLEALKQPQIFRAWQRQ